ncbi:hypothetical protein CDAR_182101 [Caerostris darwini]|uniref:Uncharacterized protein n=1 Tax=Caerostris darwini TaxID=1538125 RepID=A0AAV4PIL4_9ARAC|nr:hypothetical protein CDAR_182101 [Caerostris darwini]
MMNERVSKLVTHTKLRCYVMFQTSFEAFRVRLNDWCRHREQLTPNTFPRRTEGDAKYRINPEITSRISVRKRSGPESVVIVNFIVGKVNRAAQNMLSS